MLKQPLIVLLALTASASVTRGQPGLTCATGSQASWESVGTQFEGGVQCMLVYDDGSGLALYVGGSFKSVGGVPASGVAKWDGSTWSAVGGGGGNFSGYVAVLAAFDDGTGEALYAGGMFTTIGDTPANHIATWDGSSWSPLGDGVGNLGGGVVHDLIVHDDGAGQVLFVSGKFETAGTAAVRNIARWDGTIWSDVGGGVSNHLSAMEVFDDGSGPLLVAGGTFGSAGGVSAPWMAVWDGNAWAAPTGGAPNGHPGTGAMRIIDDGSGPALYVGGAFTSAGGVSAWKVARWDGVVWTAPGNRLDSKVHAVIQFDAGNGPVLFVGGMFSKKHASAGDHVVWLNGPFWWPVGGGMDGAVLDFVVFDDGTGPALYAGGIFETAGGFPAKGVARLTCGPAACQADCDQSTGAGVLDIFDFLCFQNAFVTADPYACDCDTSTGNGVCDMLDFICFQEAFVAGCP